jgi:hypothetical protein
MTLTIYRNKRSLNLTLCDPPYPYAIEWDEWSFEPIPRRRWRVRGSESIHERSDPYALKIITPPLAQLVDQPTGKHLAWRDDKFGIGAESCAFLAFAGKRGFRLAAKEVVG